MLDNNNEGICGALWVSLLGSVLGVAKAGSPDYFTAPFATDCQLKLLYIAFDMWAPRFGIQRATCAAQRACLVPTTSRRVAISRPTYQRGATIQATNIMADTLNHASLEGMMPGFMKWIHKCNNGADAIASGKFLPFTVDERIVGYIPHTFAQQHLATFPKVFSVDATGVSLTSTLHAESLEQRSAAVGAALTSLRDAGVISGWRDELYPVLTSFCDPPALLIERAAAPFFGIKAYGKTSNTHGLPIHREVPWLPLCLPGAHTPFPYQIVHFCRSAHEWICGAPRRHKGALGCPPQYHQAHVAWHAGPHSCRGAACWHLPG